MNEFGPENLEAINLQEVLKMETTASELVAPILLMVILFALNGVIIYYIHKARKNAFRERSSKFSDQLSESGRLYYGSMDNETKCSLRVKSSKSKMKNWEPSMKISNERRP